MASYFQLPEIRLSHLWFNDCLLWYCGRVRKIFGWLKLLMATCTRTGRLIKGGAHCTPSRLQLAPPHPQTANCFSYHGHALLRESLGQDLNLKTIVPVNHALEDHSRCSFFSGLLFCAMRWGFQNQSPSLGMGCRHKTKFCCVIYLKQESDTLALLTSLPLGMHKLPQTLTQSWMSSSLFLGMMLCKEF